MPFRSPGIPSDRGDVGRPPGPSEHQHAHPQAEGGRTYSRSIQVHGVDKQTPGDNKDDSAESGAETTHDDPWMQEWTDDSAQVVIGGKSKPKPTAVRDHAQGWDEVGARPSMTWKGRPAVGQAPTTSRAGLSLACGHRGLRCRAMPRRRQNLSIRHPRQDSGFEEKNRETQEKQSLALDRHRGAAYVYQPAARRRPPSPSKRHGRDLRIW